MKFKSIYLAIFVFLAACSPQVTVTSEEATVTLTPPPTNTPIPTPTLYPQFLALQDQIAASGERFTLNPDGTISDGATTIPGLHVAPDGTVTITVDGEPVEIDPASIHTDDEAGLSIDGYENVDGDDDFEPAETGLTPELQAIVEGWGGHLSINKDGQFLNKDDVVIEGLILNKESKMVEITRADAVGYDWTEQFDPKLVEVRENEAGEVDETINYVFSLGKDGQLERLKYKETSEYLYTQNEVLKMIADNHSTADNANLDTVPHLKKIMSDFWVKDPSGTKWYIKFGDFYEEVGSPGSTLFGTNKVKIWNRETQKEEIIDTSEYAGVGFGGKDGDSSYAMMAWMDANDNPISRIVHGGKNINNGSGWWGIR